MSKKIKRNSHTHTQALSSMFFYERVLFYSRKNVFLILVFAGVAALPFRDETFRFLPLVHVRHVDHSLIHKFPSILPDFCEVAHVGFLVTFAYSGSLLHRSDVSMLEKSKTPVISLFRQTFRWNKINVRKGLDSSLSSSRFFFLFRSVVATFTRAPRFDVIVCFCT